MNNEELLQRRYRYLGKSSPMFYDEPLHLVRGEGVWLFDADGRKYLDVYNNVPHVGHCHPQVVEALTRQAKTLNIHTRYLHQNIVNYAERLIATFDDSLSMVMFSCTGSEANEIALRMARHYTGGTGFIVTDEAYHGNTTAVAELGLGFMPEAKNCRHVRGVPTPDSFRALNNLEGRALADAYADEVNKAIESLQADGIKLAGMLICPDFANEGLVNIPEGYMAKAIGYVRRAGGLYIADEVQTGFGRTGRHMWAHQWEDVTPDIVTMGKPMGNGHPMSGVVARGDLVTAFGESGMYFNTFGGNPVSCAVGIAVLDVLERENLLDNAVAVGDYAAQLLKELQKKHDLIGDVRHRGLFFAADLVRDRNTREPATQEANIIINKMRERGVLISKIGKFGSILKMRPPMSFSKDNADLLVSTLDDVLTSL